ncbi:MAG: response regulator transcription factor [Chloroflexi bacterium]|nr:response regulator transcription factor [Chloroflexota bacterium]
MQHILIIADKGPDIEKLLQVLQKEGYDATIRSNPEGPEEDGLPENADLCLLDLALLRDKRRVESLVSRLKESSGLPIIALVPEERSEERDITLGVDDFVLSPYRPQEVLLRIRYALWRTKGVDSREVIRCGDLSIDTVKYEVRLAGRLVVLTFKEYELLKFFASNPGKVFTRDTLLSKVWGYDYLGGTRTIDVHIRRLRGKIEDSTHSFIETIRNVGYRFIKS